MRVLACVLWFFAVVVGIAYTQQLPVSPPDTAEQETETLFTPKLYVRAKSYGDSVVLRWAPSSPPSWKAYNRIGYIVERALIDPNETGPLRYERLTPEPLRPWSLEEWKRRSRPEQNFAAIAVQCLYGKLFVPKAESMPTLVDMVHEQQNRYSFALFAADCDPHTANGLGLRLVDSAVVLGQVISYRVFPARQDSLFFLDTTYIVVDVEPLKSGLPPQQLRAIESDREVTLQWENPFKLYTGFNIYRRTATEPWMKLNSMPIVHAQQRGMPETSPWFSDTTADYVRYTYRVTGIDPFGDESEPAEIIAGAADRTPPPVPVLQKPRVYGMTMVRLEWEIAPTPDLKGFVVMNSDRPDDNFRLLHKELLPPQTRTFLDTIAGPDRPFYVVVAFDTANNPSQHMPIYVEIKDTLPPAKPKNLHGSIDTNGVVRLSWSLGTEADLMGYRVLWANDSTHEFSSITNEIWMDTTFVDTVSLNTLTRHVYYRVVAVDTRYYHSEPSDLLVLVRPDVVPPVAPIFTDVYVTETSVSLQWESSSSDDVKRQVLLRRVRGIAEWEQRAELPPAQRSFTDTAVVQNTMYEYTLFAEDSSGLRSPQATPVQARPYDSGVRPAPVNVRVRYDDKRRSVIVEWDYPTAPPKERYWFVVYRAVDHHTLMQLEAVEPTVLRFEDRRLVGRGRYRYAVRVMSATGQSRLSEEQTVVVE